MHRDFGLTQYFYDFLVDTNVFTSIKKTRPHTQMFGMRKNDLPPGLQPKSYEFLRKNFVHRLLRWDFVDNLRTKL